MYNGRLHPDTLLRCNIIHSIITATPFTMKRPPPMAKIIQKLTFHMNSHFHKQTY